MLKWFRVSSTRETEFVILVKAEDEESALEEARSTIYDDWIITSQATTRDDVDEIPAALILICPECGLSATADMFAYGHDCEAR